MYNSSTATILVLTLVNTCAIRVLALSGYKSRRVVGDAVIAARIAKEA